MNTQNTQSKSFMHGAIILLIANALVKVIGAVFKIPLTYILGEEGMGYFSTSYQMYTWMFIIATAGLPVAISKMVSESKAKSRNREIKRIFAVSFRLLSVIGIIGCVLLYFGAEFCAKVLLKNPGAAYGIKAIAPAMLFVSLMSAYRGFFQGHQNMIPTAISEVVEAIGKLVIGFGAAYLLVSAGMEKASAGAVFGVSCGGFLGFVALSLLYKKQSKYAAKETLTSDTACESDRRILKTLIKIAVPITIGASVFSLTSLIDMAMIMRRLQAGGIAYKEANRLWGSYSGYAFPMFNLPPTLINAITISIVPAIAGAYAIGNRDEASRTTSKSMKITILFALPCAVGMSVLSEPILALVYHNTNAANTLSILSCAIIFVSLVLVTNAILQATGKVMIPVINMLIGGIAKVTINFILVAMPSINIQGAPIGTTTCYVVILILNLIAMHRQLQFRFSITELILKPLLSVLAMTAAVLGVFSVTKGFGNLISTVLSIGVGVIVYLIVLVIVKGINEEDIALLPKSDKLIPLCRKLKIIR